jgi:protease-4
MRNPSPGDPPIPTTQVVIYQQSFLSRLFTWLACLGCVVLAFVVFSLISARSDYLDTTGGIEEKFVQGDEDGTNKVAILSVEGLIVSGDGFVKQQIDKIREDENIKAIVLRVDSPGGTVTGSDYILHHLNKLREERKIPLVVSMGSLAASGGYYVSMAVGDQPDTIFAEPTTLTGSIGVIIPHYDLSGLLARFDVKEDSIASHERKQMLSMTKPMPEEHRALIQAQIDAMFARFKSIIHDGRPAFKKDPEALDKLATGELFNAEQAKESGLIDRIGFVEEAIERAIELAALDSKTTRVVRYRRPSQLLDVFGVAQAKAAATSPIDLPQLSQLAMPRGWYLAAPLATALGAPRAE